MPVCPTVIAGRGKPMHKQLAQIVKIAATVFAKAWNFGSR